MLALYKAYHGLQGYAAGLTAIGKAEQPAFKSMFSNITHVKANDVSMIDDFIKFGSSGKIGGFIIEPL